MIARALLPLPLLLAACQTDPMDPKVVDRKMIGLQQKFDLIDLDGDGYLTKQEIIGGFDDLGVVNQTPETADAIIAFYDFDGDQRVSLREAQSGAVSGADELLRRYRAGELNR
jgi:hypothetical protein